MAPSLGAIAGALVWLASSASAQPQSFPLSFDRLTLLEWLTSETQVQPGDVVSVSASDLISLQRADRVLSLDGELLVLDLHAEVLSSQLADEQGYLSWSARLAVDCTGERVQMLSVTQFLQRDLGGVSRSAPVDVEWIKPDAGTQLASVLRASCDPSAERPFRSRLLQKANR